MHVASNDDGPPIDHVKGGDAEHVTAAGFKLIGDLAARAIASGTGPLIFTNSCSPAGYRSS